VESLFTGRVYLILFSTCCNFEKKNHAGFFKKKIKKRSITQNTDLRKEEKEHNFEIEYSV
jgi:hypothetical protein